MNDPNVWWELKDYIFSPDVLARTDAEVSALTTLAGGTRREALDLCCGGGRHALALARRGLNVTGVDYCAPLIMEARHTAAVEGLGCEFVLAPAETFVRAEAYDLALLLFTSFGVAAAPPDDGRIVSHLFTSLRADGVAVLDCVTKETVARWFRDVSVVHTASASLYRHKRVVDGWSRLEHEWVEVRGTSVRRWVFSHRLYSASELVDFFEAAGFRDIRVQADFEGGPYDVDAGRAVIVGRKLPQTKVVTPVAHRNS